MSSNLSQLTPFAAVVRTARSSKALKGTPLTVISIFDGKYGECAVCYTNSGRKIFQSVDNLDHTGPADQKELAKIKQARNEERNKGERRVEVGEPDWSNERCVAFDWTAEFTADPTLARLRGGTKRVRLFFPREKRDGTPLFENGTVPGWLFDAKMSEAKLGLLDGFEITEKW